MESQPHAHLYAHTPVWFWPWLWWQLFRLNLWMAATGRGAMVAVDLRGHLHVTAIGDDPALWKPSPHPRAHQYALTAPLSGESREQGRSRRAAAYAPGIGVQAWIISPRALGFEIPEICQAQRPAIRDPVLAYYRLSRA